MEVIIDSRNAYRFHKFLNEQGLSYTHETRYTPDNWYTKFVIQGNRDKIISDYFLEDGNRDVDFAADFTINKYQKYETGPSNRSSYDEEFSFFYEEDEETGDIICTFDELVEAGSSLMMEKEYLTYEEWVDEDDNPKNIFILTDKMYDYIAVQRTSIYDDFIDYYAETVIKVSIDFAPDTDVSLKASAKANDREEKYTIELSEKEKQFFRNLLGKG